MKVRFQTWFLCVALSTGSYSAAANTTEPQDVAPENKILSLSAIQGDWVFSGTVINESGERYNYYFQMHRKGTQFSAVAALIDGQTKAALVFEESSATIAQPEISNWRVGHTFLKFNPINNSWIFGVKTKDKKGFNFKADMLTQVEHRPAVQDLRSGMELLVNQTGRLNGHVQHGADGTEEFVTGQKAWFRQIWLSKPQESLHPFTGILCQFNDGSGFYAVNLQEADALRGAIAGWRDPQGKPGSMSQFVSIKEGKDGLWSIHINSPKINLLLQDALAKEGEKHHLIAGVTDDLWPGFCAINKDEIGQLPEPKPEHIS
ncbi:Uncharacterised protein [Legionella lansingensis]|uniref:Uncharacterized protein n=1 Tax=Legionella lansingensis TaxID=45067 RepID=A0A0W0W121_9GAMM|nr:hypothetical protein [Legionella lansingensis]KTD26128.1 hypothetical protein Llan_0023 [Legionella lansingensis]SNV52655.1 Uncharacterised protein [Legionella lansingensis]